MCFSSDLPARDYGVSLSAPASFDATAGEKSVSGKSARVIASQQRENKVELKVFLTFLEFAHKITPVVWNHTIVLDIYR